MIRGVLLAATLAACADKPARPHAAYTVEKATPPAAPVVAPAHVAAPKRHASHEHAHGAHPHPGNDHHHHPHPHPHLAGPDDHHHPY